MKFRSTRNSSKSVGFSECLLRGLAPDGGLYVPEHFPEVPRKEFATDLDFSQFAGRLISYFCGGDPLLGKIPGICDRAFNFPLKLENYGEHHALLELFHGPTCAFKDFGARFLSECLAELAISRSLVLVATSGDTGSAVAAAFYQRDFAQVGILFPKGKVSPRQQQQLTCWDKNITAFEVNGTFDDCQQLVKEAFREFGKSNQRYLTSANSINLGRLLPQMSYFAWAANNYVRSFGCSPNIIVPTGNMGNSLGAFWAKKLGFPIGQIILATNANRVIADFYGSGNYQPRPSQSTLANAMDVGAPSNLERLRDLHTLAELRGMSQVATFSDDQISQEIQRFHRENKKTICPHTATGTLAQRHLSLDHCLIAATAHPAKFHEIVEPLTGELVPVPQQLSALLERPQNSRPLTPDTSLFMAELSRCFGFNGQAAE